MFYGYTLKIYREWPWLDFDHDHGFFSKNWSRLWPWVTALFISWNLYKNTQSVGWIENKKLYLEHCLLEYQDNYSWVEINYKEFSWKIHLHQFIAFTNVNKFLKKHRFIKSLSQLNEALRASSIDVQEFQNGRFIYIYKLENKKL